MQLKVNFFEDKRLWLFVDINHVLRAYRVQRLPETKLVEEFNLAAHDDSVTCLVSLGSLDLFASSSLDGKLKIWNWATHELESESMHPRDL